MSRDPSVARKLWQRLELVHAVTYFAPEAIGALRDVGYRGFWMGYFAGRAAPLGAAGPQVVGALFYNFAPSRVSRALPDAWGFAPPEAALEALADQNIPFTVKGKATYEQQLAAIRGTPTPPVQ